MFGRAEKLTFQFSYGTKETSYGLSFFKPQPGYFERKYVTSFLNSYDVIILKISNISVSFSLTLNLYKVTGQFPWSSLKETDRGVSAELNVRRRFSIPADPTLTAAAADPPLFLVFAVSCGRDEPHAEVGGGVEGAGLPGTQRLLRSAGGERTLAEICPISNVLSWFYRETRRRSIE